VVERRQTEMVDDRVVNAAAAAKRLDNYEVSQKVDEKNHSTSFFSKTTNYYCMLHAS
jgi:hypothetical protein